MPYPPQVFVYTWGTTPGGKKYARAFDKNPGHISIAIRVPVNEETTKLIEKYSKKFERYKIPIVTRDVQMPGIVQMPGNKVHQMGSEKKEQKDLKEDLKETPKENLNLQVEKKEAPEQYYEIYFSYWPDPKLLYSFKKSLEDDQADERRGINFPWHTDRANAIGLELEHRKKVILGPELIVHHYPKEPKTKEEAALKENLDKFKKIYEDLRKLNNDKWKVNKEISKAKKGQKNDLNKHLKELDSEIKTLEQQKKELEKILKENGDFERHISVGKPPDHTTKLPVAHGTMRGLNIEGMFEGMILVAENSEGYEYYTHNCANAAATVLRNGLQTRNKDLSEKFNDEISTPQSIYTKVITLESAFALRPFENKKTLKSAILSGSDNYKRKMDMDNPKLSQLSIHTKASIYPKAPIKTPNAPLPKSPFKKGN